jgi:hypothetical protein
MKRNSWILVTAFTCAVLASYAAGEDKCTFHTTNARYGTTCQGFVSLGGPLEPFTLLGTCTGNSTGFFSCQGTQSFNGLVVPAVDTGQAVVNSDCTGQITYNPGTQTELDINFLILHDGEELRGMLQNPGSAVQCDLIRINSGKDHD